MFEEYTDACIPFITFMKTKIKSGRCKCLLEVIYEVCYQFEEQNNELISDEHLDTLRDAAWNTKMLRNVPDLFAPGSGWI